MESPPELEISSLTTHKTSRPTDLGPVLQVLDFEIERIRAEQRRPGWTMWAIYGAIASALWLLSEQIASGTTHLTNVLQLVVAFVLIVYLLEVLKMIAPESQRGGGPQVRFRWFHHSTNRLVIGIDLLRAVSITLIALTITAGLRWYHITAALLIFGGMTLLSLAILVATFFKFPVKTGALPIVGWLSRTIAGLIWSGEISLFGWLAYAYIGAVRSSAEIVSLADVRIAALLVAMSVGLRIVANESLTSPLLLSLIETRRDLVFGHLDLDTAISNAEIAIAGMNESDVLQEDVQGILRSVEQIDKRVIKAARHVEEFKSLHDGTKLAPDERELAQMILNHGQAVIEYSRDFNEELEKQIKAFRRRLWFIEYSETSGSRIAEVQFKIGSAREASDLRIRNLVQGLEDLETLRGKDDK